VEYVNSSINGTATITGDTPSGIGDGSYYWRVLANDGTLNSSWSEIRYFTVDNSTLKYAVYTTPSPVYETSSNEYSVNVTINNWTSSDILATLVYDDTEYTPTKTTVTTNSSSGVYQFKATAHTRVSITSANAVWNFTVTLNNASTETYSVTKSQTIHPINFDLCANTSFSATEYINFSFKNEADSSVINASVPSSTFYYSIGTIGVRNKTLSFSNTTENFAYAFCFDPINNSINTNIDLDYKSTGYPQRSYVNDGLVLNNISTNKILYLLKTADGVYSTYQVVNYADQVIEDVYVYVERLISGTYEYIEEGYTDSAGSITFFLNPDYEHRLTFQKSGYSTEVLTIYPTQSTYTVTLGEEETTNVSNYHLGIKYDISPNLDVLYNQTDYNFTLNMTSDYWRLTESGFVLTNGSGVHLGVASCTTATGCVSSVTVNTANHSSIKMDYYWKIYDQAEYHYLNGTRTWRVFIKGERKSVFTMFKEDVEKLGHGFNDFTKAIISIFIIIFAVGVGSYYTGVYSPLAILGEIFFLVFFLDMIGFIPNITGAITSHFITALIGVLFLGYAIFEYSKGGA
jgi:hypothetical protein